jgi:hypothetical protein
MFHTHVASLGLTQVPNITFSAQNVHSHSDIKNRQSWLYPQSASNKEKGIRKETDIQRDSSTRRYILGFSAFAVIVFAL